MPEVQSSVDALPAEAGKQFLHKGGLGEGLPAGDGDAALVPEIGAVTENLPDQLLRAAFFPGAVFPGVGVMAVGAAQGAALQKHYIPQSGSVHSPQGLHGMHMPLHHRETWNVREMTSRCCSRESL